MQGFYHHVQLGVATVSTHSVSNVLHASSQSFIKAIRPTPRCPNGVSRELASANH